MGEAEVGPYAGLVVGMGGHTHEAADTHMRHFAPATLAQKGLACLRSEAKLAFLGSHMEFKQYVDDPTTASPLFLYLPQQLLTVDSVDETDERRYIFHLVGL